MTAMRGSLVSSSCYQNGARREETLSVCREQAWRIGNLINRLLWLACDRLRFRSCLVHCSLHCGGGGVASSILSCAREAGYPSLFGSCTTARGTGREP